MAPRRTAETAFRGIAPGNPPPDVDRRGREIWGGQFRFGFGQLAADRVYWFAVVSNAPPTRSSDSPREQLREWYRSFPEPVPDLIAATPPEAIVRTETRDIDPPSTLWRGRGVLVGDAAHAATPDLAQGTAQAIEDGYELGTALAHHDVPAQAFAAYQAIRLPRARRIVRLSRSWARVAHLTRFPLPACRHLLVRATPGVVLRRQLSRVFIPAVSGTSP